MAILGVSWHLNRKGSHEETSLGYSCRCGFRATLSLEYFLAGEKAGEDQGRRRVGIGHADVPVARPGREIFPEEKAQCRSDQHPRELAGAANGAGGGTARYLTGGGPGNSGLTLPRRVRAHYAPIVAGSLFDFF